LPENAHPSKFSAARTTRHIEAIAQEPHPVGTPELAAVREYIVGEFTAIGLSPSVQNTLATRHSGDVLFGGEVTNIVARLQGKESNGAILLMAHYDTVSTSPGAVDNGSGVAVLLEMMRALKSGTSLKRDVIALITDGEEPALLGAQAFVDEHPWMADVKIVLNMGLLYRGPAVIWITSSENGWLVREWAGSVSHSASASSPFSAFMVGDTDLTPFLGAGATGAHFITAFSFPYYHTAEDRPEHMDMASIQHIGSQISQFVRHVGDLNLKSAKAPDRVYFPIMGRTLHYPVSWVVPLTIIVSILYVFFLIAGIGKKTLRWKRIGIGIFSLLISAAVSMGAMTLLFGIIRKAHPEYSLDSHPLIGLLQPHFNNDVLYLIGFIVLTVSVVAAINGLFRKKARVQELAMGALLFWLIGTVASSIVFPSSSYMFQWPLLANLAFLAMAFRTQPDGNAKILWERWSLSVLAATSALVLWVPFVHMLYLWTTFFLLTVFIGCIVLLLGAMIPLLDSLRLQRGWIMPVLLLVIGVGFLLAGHFFAHSEETIRYANAVGYWLDGDSGQAKWVSRPGELDERQVPLFEESSEVPYSQIFPLASADKMVLASRAPVAPLRGPELLVKEDRCEAGKRTLSLHITSFQKERLEIHLRPEPERLTIFDNNGNEGVRKTFSLIDDGGWAFVRFDPPPPDGLDLELEIFSDETVKISLIDVGTGLPFFPKIKTQPPALMIGPPDCSMGIPTDFTAVHKSFTLPVDRQTRE